MEKQELLQSTPKAASVISHKLQNNGFSVVEVILAAALFALIATSLVSILIYGEQSSVLAGERARANFLAEEGLEAVRNIRDAGFSGLPADGNYGLQVSGGQWAFLGLNTSDTTGIFTRQINISTVDANRKTITSTVNWQQTPQRTGSVVLTTRLTYWQKVSVATCAAYCTSLGTPPYTKGTCRRNNGACVANGETRETGGAIYCTVNPNNTCCCHP
jgi:Tfp pilus assembly protein PilV